MQEGNYLKQTEINTINQKLLKVFELKKYIGVMLHATAEWCKIWRKTDLWSGKRHKKFGISLLEHSKVSKLGLWWDLFIQSRKFVRLKFTEELCIMEMINEPKFQEELTCRFKTDTKIW